MVSRNRCATTAASMFIDHGMCSFASSANMVVVEDDVICTGNARAVGGSTENFDDLLGKLQVIPLWISRQAEVIRGKNATTKKWKPRKEVVHQIRDECDVMYGNRDDDRKRSTSRWQLNST